MSNGKLPERVQALLDQYASADRSLVLALHALFGTAREDGTTDLDSLTLKYRDDHLAAMREEGRDAEREAGRLSLDEVRHHLVSSVLPRLLSDGVIKLPGEGLVQPGARIAVAPALWAQLAPQRSAVSEMIRQTGEHHTPLRGTAIVTPSAKTSVLEAQGLVKMYRRRRVVNDVALRLQQGEIVGLLGPNGAGKTTTFYMIVGLIQPLTGRILLDGEDITTMPM
jgi:lipopolysaccharide export system ATP-binding protein